MNNEPTDGSPKRYQVEIEYLVRDTSKITIIADNTDQAERFALSGWRAQHTDACFKPEVMKVTEL